MACGTRSVFLRVRVERVSQAIAQEGEREHCKAERQRRPDKHPRIGAQIRLVLADHQPPTCLWRRNPGADEAEERLGEDRGRDTEGERDNNRGQGVRQHMSHDQPQIVRAERLRGDDEIFLAKGEELRAHEAREADPTGQADHQEYLIEAAPEHRHQQDDEEECGEGVHHIDEAHQDQVGLAAEEAGGSPDRHADREHDDLCHQPDQQGNLRAPDHPAEDIAPELIGTHRVREVRAMIECVIVLAVDRLARQDRCEEGDQREEYDDDQADDGELIPQQASPGVTPQTGLATLVAEQPPFSPQRIGGRRGPRLSRG